MPELTELLRAAGGTPEVPDLRGALVRRRRRRLRRRLAAAGVVVLVAVIGVAVVAGDPAPVRTISGPPVDAVHVQGRIQGIADDGTNLWVGVQQHRRWRVDWFDDDTGEQRGSVPVWDPIQEVVLGGGYLWVAGRNPLDEMRGGVSRIDTGTGQVERVLEWAPATGLVGGIDLAWDGRAMWAADGHGEVERLPSEGPPVRIPVGDQPRSIAVASTGAWVELGDGTVGLVDHVSGALSHRHRWGRTLFTSSGDGVWSTDDGIRAVELFPEDLDSGISVSLGDRLGAGRRPIVDVVPDADGIWIVREGRSEHWRRGASAADRVVDRPGKLAVGPDSVWIADPPVDGVRGVVHRVG